jgi:hypothetical protein
MPGNEQTMKTAVGRVLMFQVRTSAISSTSIERKSTMKKRISKKKQSCRPFSQWVSPTANVLDDTFVVTTVSSFAHTLGSATLTPLLCFPLYTCEIENGEQRMETNTSGSLSNLYRIAVVVLFLATPSLPTSSNWKHLSRFKFQT